MTEWILSSSILILIVICMRAVLKGRIRLRLQYAMWGLVLLRLMIPFSIGSADFSVANFVSRADVPAVVDQTVKPQEKPLLDHPTQHMQQVQPGEKPSQNAILDAPATDAMHFIVDAYIFYGIWIAGAAAIAALFFATNLQFRRRIMSSRYVLDIRKSDLFVYVSGQIDTPCLFGITNPAIYVTNDVAENLTMLRHTLEHEATHYRHGDHIWGVLRCICLVIHWYNPFVWWAAFLSQRDAELACDEATILRLGEEERVEYGRTLIGMTCRKRVNLLTAATTMSTSKSGIKERIRLIARKPKMTVYTLVTVILAACIAVGCTFTGAKNDEDVDGAPPSATESMQSSETEQTTSSTALPSEKQPVQTLPIQQSTENTAAPSATEITEVTEPANALGISKIKTATLQWNGVHTVNDTYALKCIEKMLVNARELESAACPFSVQLTLEMEDGQTRILYMAEDSCAAFLHEGVAYSYAELTEEGYTDNVPFYSLFAQEVIREKSQEGLDGALGYLHYLNWISYYNQCGSDETFALLNKFEAWVAENPTYERFGCIIACGKGLDGAIAEGYGYTLAALYELAPKEFAWACLGNATDEAEERTIFFLAFEWEMTREEARAKLEAQL